MNLKTLLDRYSIDDLKAAIRLSGQRGRVEALEAKKDALLKQVAKIDRKLSKLNDNGSTAAAAKPGRKRRRWKLSKATREKMRLSALRRYGKLKPEAPKPERKTRKLTAAGRAAISAAAKSRWERLRKAKAEPKAAAPEAK